MSERMPAIFFGHGNPMNALAENKWTRGWAEIGRSIARPSAILCISAHWYVSALAVTAMQQPTTIHDFGGFPRELFEFQYPAPGSPQLANRMIELLGDDCLADEGQWGLDHGTWSVLCHAFPDADIPVVQLSLDETREASWHYELAQKLRPLRDEGVLIVGSGDVVHNLHTYAWGRDNVEAFDWAMRFENAARELISAGEHGPLIEYETMGKDALLSVPTPDHYLPLLYVLAQQTDEDEVSFPVEGFDGGSVSMLSVRIG